MGMCGYRDRIWHSKKSVPKKHKHEAVVPDRVQQVLNTFRSFVRRVFRGKVKV